MKITTPLVLGLALAMLISIPLRGQTPPDPLPPSFSWLAYPHPSTGQPVSAVTPARDQYSPVRTGTCWAHVVIAGLESLVLIDAVAADPNVDPAAPAFDFSEFNLVRCAPMKERTCLAGGFESWSAAYLTRAGAAAEQCEPLGLCAGPVAPCAEDCPRLVTPLGWRQVENDVEDIKDAVYHLGPVMSNLLNRNPDFFNLAPDRVFYWPIEPKGELNHSLLIVGYDDHKEVYDGATLAGRGAFLVKNSNPNWSDRGFGWIAYNSARIGSLSSVFTEFAPYNPEEDVYGFDDWGQTAKDGDTQSGPEWGMVNFTIARTGLLHRVDFWTVARDTSYQVRVYEKFADGKLRKLVAARDGKCDRPGYYSVALDHPPTVLVADNIYVAVSFEAPGESRPVPLDRRGPFTPGRSYLSHDGETWAPVSGRDAAIRIRVVPEDRDGDQMPNYWEKSYKCLDPETDDAGRDPDRDGLSSGGEYGFARALYGASTDPCAPDSDHDGLTDGWEWDHKECVSRLAPDAAGDPDHDGLSNIQEFDARSNPCGPGPASAPQARLSEAERFDRARGRDRTPP